MNLTDYQPLALRTEKPLPTPLARLRHAVLGLITETGEYATEAKRIAIYEKSLDDVDEKTKLTRRQHMAEELSDVMWYAAIGVDAIGYKLSTVLEMAPVVSCTLEDVPFYLARQTGHLADILIGDYPLDADVSNYVASLIASIVWTVISSATALDTTLAQVCAENVAKLQKRFPDAYSNEAAEARADKGGLDARNS